LEVLKTFPDNCIDTIITDPPYGIGFMGKEWDSFEQKNIKKYVVPEGKRDTSWGHSVGTNSPALLAGSYDFSLKGKKGFQKIMYPIMKELLRVTKPGGTMLIFGGTRTYHRLACAIEDAGWIIKDCIMWIYGSGFPKATDISKQLDKKAGKERKIIGRTIRIGDKKVYPKNSSDNQNVDFGKYKETKPITRPVTPEAKLWNGWKSHGLKPAYEPILVAMKPNEGSYAQNALKWGVSGLNIDGGRIGTEKISVHGYPRHGCFGVGGKGSYGTKEMKPQYQINQGRFPANLILDEEAAKMLDRQSGERSFGNKQGGYSYQGKKYQVGGFIKDNSPQALSNYGDKGGASRFFYVAKASREERNRGLEGFEKKSAEERTPKGQGIRYTKGFNRPATNPHPTVKPLKLMEYLCILTKTPTGGIVLDPFAGSGTTGMAAKKTKRPYILIEKEKEYCEIAEARIKATPETLF